MEIACIASGMPEPKIVWINTDRDRVVSNGKTLEIESTQPSDTGAYTCVAKNAAAEVYKEIIVKIQIPPRIKKSGRQQRAVITGDSVTLNCHVMEGDPEPNIIWFKDGQRLDSTQTDGAIMFLERQQTLKILVVQAQHSGIYECRATSAAGDDKFEYEIDVYRPPQIITSTRQVSGVEGTSMTLKCLAEGNPKPEVIWRKNGHVIDLNSVIVQDSHLVFPSLRPVDHAGVYTCSAINTAGTNEATFSVDVWEVPEINEQISNTSISTVNQTVGNAISLYCQVDSHPPPVITWFINGKPIRDVDPQGIYLSEGNRKLTINEVTIEDIGDYVCEATNKAGSDKFAYHLNVNQLPAITNHRHEYVSRQVDDSVSLLCKIERGQPTPKITWFVNDTIVEPDNSELSILADGTILSIPKLKVSLALSFINYYIYNRLTMTTNINALPRI